MKRAIRIIAGVTAAACIAAGGAAIGSTERGNKSRVITPVSTSSVVETYSAGPGAVKSHWKNPYQHNDIGNIVVDPTLVAVPADAEQYQALITMTLRYVTRGRGPFTFGVVVDTGIGGGDSGTADDVKTFPRSYAPVAAARTKRTVTLQFVVPRLQGGTTYRITPEASTVLPREGTNRIQSRSVVLALDLLPL